MRRSLGLLAGTFVAGVAIAGCSGDDDASTAASITTRAERRASATTSSLTQAAEGPLEAFKAWAGNSGAPGHTDTSWQGPWLDHFDADGGVIIAVLAAVGPEFENPAEAQAELATSVCEGMSQYIDHGSASNDGVIAIRVLANDGTPLLVRSYEDSVCRAP